MLVYCPQSKVQNRVKSFLHKFPLVRARLPRAEFQAIGMKPGPKFEKILEQVFYDQLDGKIKTHQQVIKQLRALSGLKEPPPPEPPKLPKPPKPTKAAPAPKPPAKPAKEAEKSTRPAASPKRVTKARPGKKESKPARISAGKKNRKKPNR